MNTPGGFRSSMQRRPADPGKIEKARDPRNALTRLLPYLNPFKVVLVLVLAFVLIYTVLGLIGPYLMGVAIDKFIATKDTAGLVNIAIWMLAVYLLNNLFQAVSAWLMSDVSQRALKQLRKDLFGHLQTLSIGFFDSNPAGDLMSRLTNDIDAINQAVSQNVTSLLASVLSLVGILIAMFVLDKWLALASVLVVPIMFWFTEFVARYTRRGFRDLQKQLGGLNGVMEEAISGQKVVKAFRRNESAIETFRKSNQEVFRAGVSANSYAPDKRVGQLLCNCAGRSGRMAGFTGTGQCGDYRHLHQLWAELRPAFAPTGKYVQFHPGCAGRGGTGLRDHRYPVRSGRCA
jgi:ATP-binding cassette subfamily B multidrug efflux pump